MPFLYRHIDISFGSPVTLESWQAWSLMAAGFLLSLLALHLLNGMATVFRWLSDNLLNTGPRQA
jgi:ribose/xylose/arabinose/galactoside ABC-type transport system permease subunit